MFGLVDCNNFYVSCERVFQPRLEGQPVVVLSNNDSCIISRSQEAKALGLKMGEPYFQVREQLRQHGVQVFSSNYALYGDMSRRVMHYLGQTVPGVEIYSIDEAFLDLGGLQRHLTPYLGKLDELASEIRAQVKQRTGIPTCVGVAPTKTLAKLANRLAKKDAALGGVLYLDSPERRRWALGQVAIGDVWGIGRQYAHKLTAVGIDSAADLAKVSEAWARKMLGGVVGARLVRELQGYPCAGLHPSEDGTLSRQSISCSRTFGRPLTAQADVLAAVTSFLSRAAEKLRRQGDQAYVLTVYVQKNRFDSRVPPPYSRSATLTLPGGPTADTLVLARYAAHLLARVWEPGTVYHKAGVVLDGLEPPSSGQQLGLFAAPAAVVVPPAPVLVTKRADLMAQVDALNARYGRGTVRLGSTVPALAVMAGHTRAPWQGQAHWQSPAFTTRLEDLLTVR
ncbi:Y-family DNA polymerase [Hymenobacter sp. RP-2-7]|uniref:Y-family DNA polymerase n=1 Tax=Hymenobacter polaris TaxID=2682546 RepID=A0A7Y0AID3_9BACT|nr:Y-family DNA polymerase [Hymenobacter polaris]NML67931.1 Y-family DNA polymerase [Hymenobacter polaris]